jgi:hypothetical protein
MEKEPSSLKKENTILKIACVVLLVAGVGLYIYGYLQKDFALAKHEEALGVTVQLKECEVEVARQKEIAIQADMEASYQKQVASDYFIKWMEAKSKKK